MGHQRSGPGQKGPLPTGDPRAALSPIWRAWGAPLRVLPGPSGRLPSGPPLLGSQQLACSGPGERSKNRFQDGLKSVGKLASRWGQLLPTRVNYFEPRRSYFKVWTEVRSRPRRAVSKYPAHPGRAGQAEQAHRSRGPGPRSGSAWTGSEGGGCAVWHAAGPEPQGPPAEPGTTVAPGRPLLSISEPGMTTLLPRWPPVTWTVPSHHWEVSTEASLPLLGGRGWWLPAPGMSSWPRRGAHGTCDSTEFSPIHRL